MAVDRSAKYEIQDLEETSEEDAVTEQDLDNMFFQESGRREYYNEDPPEEPYFVNDDIEED